MQVNVSYLDNLRLEASFDNYKVLTDQPVRYKGDGTAPSPYDYFLASSALCAAYFVKVYCNARNIPTDDLKVIQNNIVDPDNRYHQDFVIQIELPEGLSQKDKDGILAAMERCTVKRVIQNGPKFTIEAIEKGKSNESDALNYQTFDKDDFKTQIVGKDCTLEETITTMRSLLQDLGIKIEIASWRNPVPHVWSVHIRDAESPLCYTNGKGATKESALCSALGEFLERLSSNYFYADYYLGPQSSEADFVHYPDEKWFPLEKDGSIPMGLLDKDMLALYNPDGELKGEHLLDTNSGLTDKGICALPFVRQSDQEKVYIPVNLIGNLFVSNGMSAGNSLYEARVQCLSEIFERAIKNQILYEELCLPDVPKDILEKFPTILEGINALDEKGFPVLVKDASLGGRFPVMCVTLMNPKTGGVYASFGAHPNFEVALERSLTELLQGRSFEGLDDMPPPTFNSVAVQEPNNIVDHFIDSTGVVSWRFFSSKADFDFSFWNFKGTTHEEFDYLMGLFKELEKEVYIADYNDLGAHACRILVPGFSEIYPIDDLIWDNNNRALAFREDIINLHHLEEDQRASLLERLEDYELDDYMPISELIGIAFDETDAWGRLTVGELKGLLHISLENFEEAKMQVDLFLSFNDSSPKRRRFYQVLAVLLECELDEELSFEDYQEVLVKLHGEELVNAALKTLSQEAPFYDLRETSLDLTGLSKHKELVDSYSKLLKKRSN